MQQPALPSRRRSLRTTDENQRWPCDGLTEFSVDFGRGMSRKRSLSVVGSAPVLRPRGVRRPLAITRPAMLPSASVNGVGTPKPLISRLNSRACTYPCQRFAHALTYVHGRGRDGPSPLGSARPPHRSQRAGLPHWAPALGTSVESLFRPRVCQGPSVSPRLRPSVLPDNLHRFYSTAPVLASVASQT